jgi:Holliday junction resolvase
MSVKCALKYVDGIELMKSGITFERKFKKMLEEGGTYVMRSAGSRGAADLIAIDEFETSLYQIKSTKKESSTDWIAGLKHDVSRLLDLKKHERVNLYLILYVKNRAWYEACITNWKKEEVHTNLKNWLDFIEDHPLMIGNEFVYTD